MAGVYRSMIAEDGRPVVGNGAKMLGVRNDGYDIPFDADENVRPRTGGLSVVSNWHNLPLFLIPRRLQPQIKDARGSNQLACFRLGDFPFQDGQINDVLAMRPDSPHHGTIQPNRKMPLPEYQDALAATRSSWVIDET